MIKLVIYFSVVKEANQDKNLISDYIIVLKLQVCLIVFLILKTQFYKRYADDPSFNDESNFEQFVN